MNDLQESVSFSSVKSLDIFPGLNFHVHRLADHIKSNNGKRAVLACSFVARPADHFARSVALGILIPLSHADAIVCGYKRKSRLRLAVRAVVLTPLQAPRIPIECALYFFGRGAKDFFLNFASTGAGFINPKKKTESYFLKRHMRESNPKNKVIGNFRRNYQLKSYDNKTIDAYKTIMVRDYEEYDKKKAHHKKFNKLGNMIIKPLYMLKIGKPPYNACQALNQQITLKIFSY